MSASAPVSIETVLVPVDGSEESLTAVEYAVAIAKRYGAGVHALYVVGEDVIEDVRAGRLDEAELDETTEEFVAAVRDLAPEAVAVTHSTAHGFSPTRKTQHPGSVALDAAEDVDADFIVIPREPLAATPGEVLEKAAEYVLLYASQPVLSV